MILSDEINLTNKIDVIDTLLNHMANLHEQGFFKVYKNIFQIKKTKSNNLIEMIRQITVKQLFPKFIIDMIPPNLWIHLTQYKEQSIWDIDNKQWVFEYNPISGEKLYTLEGFCIITNNTILIKLEFNINEKIPLQELIEKTIVQIIMNTIKNGLADLNDENLHKLIPMKIDNLTSEEIVNWKNT